MNNGGVEKGLPPASMIQDLGGSLFTEKLPEVRVSLTEDTCLHPFDICQHSSENCFSTEWGQWTKRQGPHEEWVQTACCRFHHTCACPLWAALSSAQPSSSDMGLPKAPKPL